MSLAILVAAIFATVLEPRAMTTLRHAAFDTYQRLKPREYRPAPVRVIDIDEESLSRHGQWPWPRTTLARLIEQLESAGAVAIALDMLLAEEDRTSPRIVMKPWRGDPVIEDLVRRLPNHDRVFARQLEGSPVVTGFILNQEEMERPDPTSKSRMVTAGDSPLDFLPTFRGAVASLPEFEIAAAGNGALNMIPGTDGVVRTLPLLLRHGDAIWPGLAAEALRLAEGEDNYVVKASGASGESRFGGRTGIVNVRIGSIPIATDARGGIWLHYSRPVPERTIPAWQVLAGEVAGGTLDQAIVFLGTSAAGLLDLRLDSLGRIAPGAEVHAQAVEQILQQSYLTRPDWARAAEILFMVAMWAVLVTLILRFGALPAALIGATAILGAYLGSWFAFDRFRLLLDPTFPSLTALSVYLVCSVAQQWQAERDRTWIRQAFSSYISPNLVRHLIDNPEELSLGGERRECSFVMTDLEGFTSLVEQSDPEQVVGLLNQYLDGIVRIALEHEGTIDRIVGDAVAVMFSAPAIQPDHASRAAACAVRIDTFARRFSAAKSRKGVEIGRTRIGVNTGTVTVGNVGGERIVDYRALGDAVNTAARLETVNRQLGTEVCISGTTVAACPRFRGRPVGWLVLKGKSAAIEAFEPLSPERDRSEAVLGYRQAFTLMDSGDPAAVEAFRRLHEEHPDDPLIGFHCRRLAAGESGSTVTFTEK